MDKVFKTYRATVKEVNADEGTVDLMIPISTGQVDRDGEIIEPTAFKKTIPKFMKHPVLVASHDYRALTSQIGEWTKLKVEDNGVSGKPKYYINAGNDQADWAYYLASKGVAAFSVGFIPKVWEDGDGEKSPRRTYKEVELLEISQVIIPSNREAIQSMRSKSVDDPVITELCDEVEKTIEEIEVTKPEETDEFIRIPVRTCDVTATIDISEKEGISALYCGKEKQVRTYLFRKDKGWTLERAKAWVKEHEGKELEGGIIFKEPVIKSVIPYHKYPLDDSGNWDAAKEVGEADVNDLAKMCAIVVGDPENKTSYKLPHHRAKGYTTVWRAVTAAGAVLMGSRGGVDAPEDDIAGAKSHLAKHYKEFDKAPPWEKSVSQAEIRDEIDYLTSLIKETGIADATLKSLNNSIGGYLKQMNMDKIQEMHDMMESCETMAEESRKMAEDMMADMQEGRTPGNDIPVKTKNNIDDFNTEDVLEAIQTIKLGGK